MVTWKWNPRRPGHRPRDDAFGDSMFYGMSVEYGSAQWSYRQVGSLRKREIRHRRMILPRQTTENKGSCPDWANPE